MNSREIVEKRIKAGRIADGITWTLKVLAYTVIGGVGLFALAQIVHYLMAA